MVTVVNMASRGSIDWLILGSDDGRTVEHQWTALATAAQRFWIIYVVDDQSDLN